MVAANKGRPSRKSFSEALQAFKRFSETRENAFLYLHTVIDPAHGQGENLPALLSALEIPLDRVRLGEQYRLKFDPYSHQDMARIYSSLDVLLNPAKGEGFGVPVLEAQACGVPVIVSDFSAMREVCGAGWQVKTSPVWTGQNSWMAQPDVDDIVSALEECAGLSAAAREKLSGSARKHAMAYDLGRVVKRHMLPALRAAEQRFAAQRPVTVSPRLKAAA
jgi:glycosyltransferase involved in cell wall biosynthesis